jgi:hypothetical protein
MSLRPDEVDGGGHGKLSPRGSPSASPIQRRRAPGADNNDSGDHHHGKSPAGSALAIRVEQAANERKSKELSEWRQAIVEQRLAVYREDLAEWMSGWSVLCVLLCV